MSTDLDAKIAALPPRQRDVYDTMIAGYRAEWEAQRLAQLARTEHDAVRRSAWDRFTSAASEFTEECSVLAFVALLCIGGAGTFGICVGIVIALVRAGWRAGASL